MGVCPAIAKALNLEAFDVSIPWCFEVHARTHANASLAFSRPRLNFCWYFDVPLIKGNSRIPLVEMYVGGNYGMFKDVYRFDDTSQTRSGLEMANLDICQLHP